MSPDQQAQTAALLHADCSDEAIERLTGVSLLQILVMRAERASAPMSAALLDGRSPTAVRRAPSGQVAPRPCAVSPWNRPGGGPAPLRRSGRQLELDRLATKLVPLQREYGGLLARWTAPWRPLRRQPV